LPAKPACEAETYSELGEGAIPGKDGIFDISPVIETPLTLILSPRFAGGEERKEGAIRMCECHSPYRWR
jgi:hypothetical protein